MTAAPAYMKGNVPWDHGGGGSDVLSCHLIIRRIAPPATREN